MISRLTVLNVLSRAVAKRRLATVRTPAAVRRDFDRFATFLVRLPCGTRIEDWPPVGTCPRMTWFAAGEPDGHRALLWFHGGGFVAGSPHTHRGLAAALSKATRGPVVLPDYRLAPEHRLPAAQEDCRAAWDALRAKGYRPDDIAIGGDSAGGSLALGLLAELCAEGERPAAVVTFSALTDLTASGASIIANARADRLLPAERISELASYALGDHQPDDPRVSPLFAAFTAPPPVLMQVAETEILRDDTLRMAEHLRESGGEVEVQTWPDAPHVWQVFAGWLPEADAAIENAGTFLRAASSRRPGLSGGS